MTKSIFAIILAMGLAGGLAACARQGTSADPAMAGNPNNCSPAFRDCATSIDGSNKTQFHFDGNRKNMNLDQQSETPSAQPERYPGPDNYGG